MSRVSSKFCLLMTAVLISLVSVFFGCSSSEGTEQKGPDPKDLEYQKRVNSLYGSVDSVKQINSRLKEDLQKAQQENSNLNIKLGEAQKEISNLNVKTTENKVNESFMQEYNSALSMFNNKKYNESLALFQKLYTDDPTGDYAPNCLYWVGENYFGLKNFKQAKLSFEQVLSAYPNSSKSDDALVMMGLSYLKVNDRKNAMEYFVKLQQMYPESPYISKIPKEFKMKANENE
jgi:tol-pal system protein YbgF